MGCKAYFEMVYDIMETATQEYVDQTKEEIQDLLP